MKSDKLLINKNFKNMIEKILVFIYYYLRLIMIYFKFINFKLIKLILFKYAVLEKTIVPNLLPQWLSTDPSKIALIIVNRLLFRI